MDENNVFEEIKEEPVVEEAVIAAVFALVAGIREVLRRKRALSGLTE